MPFIPARFPRYNGYVLSAFATLRNDLSGQLENIRTLESRDSDILICTYPKSGTHWINEIISMMVKGRAEYANVHKIAAMLEAIPNFEVLQNVPESSVRILNSHLSLKELPSKHIKNGYKIVHVIRNPKDVAVSYYNHLFQISRRISDEEALVYPGSWSMFIEHFCRSDEELYNGWFNYETALERAKETGEVTNIFTTHYEQLKRDPFPVLKALAEFLGVEASDELLNDINHKCSFEQMSTVGDIGRGNDSLKSATGRNIMFRKGQIGDWKNWFTVAQNEAFDSLIETNMKDSKLKFTFE
ncbi:sulfotransferase 1B1-like [Ylistrum balloti]|uniref:sulfotransferase 1B1-like n=1 Tax=Ylistrum balloti TaxID=509963 RepID=UPI00290591FE|nr:sulfotransferase 1B1-like [Ylistrum balloti]